MALTRLGLVHDQHDAAALRGLGQHHARERLHHRVAVDPMIVDEPGNPLIAHVRPRRGPRSKRCQRHQVGGARLQHRCHQQGKRFALGLALPGQTEPQFIGYSACQLCDPASHLKSAPKRADALNHTQIRVVNRQASD